VVLGLRVWELHLEGCHSLKEKRGVLLPLKERLRRGHNLSVAETAHQDSWQRAELGCAALGTDRTVVEESLRTADRMVEAADGVRILDTMTSYR
jgi:hypothetical protein